MSIYIEKDANVVGDMFRRMGLLAYPLPKSLVRAKPTKSAIMAKQTLEGLSKKMSEYDTLVDKALGKGPILGKKPAQTVEGMHFSQGVKDALADIKARKDLVSLKTRMGYTA